MSSQHHLSRSLLDVYFQGGASSADLLAESLRALDGDCLGCRRVLAAARIDYRRAIELAQQRSRLALAELTAERADLPEVVRGLSSDSELDALFEVAGARRFHTAAFVEYQLGTGWSAADSEDRRIATRALDLADAAGSRLERYRYGRPLVAQLRGEIELLRTRLALANGDAARTAESLDVAAGLAAEAACEDLEMGLRIGRGCVALLAGDAPAARRHFTVAMAAEDASSRWYLSGQVRLGRLERRAGEAAAAARRLGRLVDTPEAMDGASSKALGVAVRERTLALLALGRPEEAERCVRRERRLESLAPASLDALEALVLPARTGPEAFRESIGRLGTSLSDEVSRGHGLGAALRLVDLARVASRPPRGLPARQPTSRDLVTLMLEDVIARCELPGTVVAVLVRLARSLRNPPAAHAALTTRLDEIEDHLLALDPPWSASHGSHA